MGQYWVPVNLTKREFIHPHDLGGGLKLGEQLGTHPGVGAALVVLCAAMPEPRGGGDLYLGDENTEYGVIARRTIGRWAGDRIALVGDYAETGDLPPEFEADKIYGLCAKSKYEGGEDFKNISSDVRVVLEHELGGKFEESSWGFRWNE